MPSARKQNADRQLRRRPDAKLSSIEQVLFSDHERPVANPLPGMLNEQLPDLRRTPEDADTPPTTSSTLYTSLHQKLEAQLAPGRPQQKQLTTLHRSTRLVRRRLSLRALAPGASALRERRQIACRCREERLPFLEQRVGGCLLRARGCGVRLEHLAV